MSSHACCAPHHWESLRIGLNTSVDIWPVRHLHYKSFPRDTFNLTLSTVAKSFHQLDRFFGSRASLLSQSLSCQKFHVISFLRTSLSLLCSPLVSFRPFDAILCHESPKEKLIPPLCPACRTCRLRPTILNH